MKLLILALALATLALLLNCQDGTRQPVDADPLSPRPLSLDEGNQVLVDTTAFTVGDSVSAINPQPVHVTDRLTPNADTRIVLHAIPYDPPLGCATPQDLGFDCVTTTATTTVSESTLVAVYVYLNDYETVSGLQLTFSWDPSWTLMAWIGGCQANAVEARTPTAQSGDLAMVFDRVYGGELAPIGYLLAQSGSTGTMLTVSESAFPGGTSVVTGQGGLQVAVPESQRGAIGVEVPGIDTCQPSEPLAGPVGIGEPSGLGGLSWPNP